jgi:hypothetical protein
VPFIDQRAAVRVVAASLGASAVFIVVLGVVAYLTRDGSGPVPRSPRADRAVAAAPSVAPSAVAAPITSAPAPSGPSGLPAPATEEPPPRDPNEAFVEPPPPIGPPSAALPPVDAPAVVAAAAVLVEACLVEALRFDPAIGGRVRVRVRLPPALAVEADAKPTLAVLDVASPVFRACLRDRAARFAPPLAAAPLEEPMIVDGLLELDALRGAVRVIEATFAPEHVEPAP